MKAVRLVPWLLTALCGLAIWIFKNPEEKWDRLIESDGRGYYAWLPATFIYQDLSFGFYDTHEKQYYPEADDAFKKDYRIPHEGKVINKYFPGLAIAWSPFFFASHAWAKISGEPADGYSMTYQYGMAMASLAYLLLGILLCRKILLMFGFSEERSAWLLTLTVLGTNLVYYASVEPVLAHVTLFALCSAVVLLFMKLGNRFSFPLMALASFLLAVIAVSRPTTLLVLAFIPFFSPSFPDVLRKAFRKPTEWWMMIPAFAVLLIPFLAWKVQTGDWLVYSYKGESLDLTEPHLLKFLFSFEKGVLVHTPMFLLGGIGLLGVLRQSSRKGILLATAMFVTLWVLSSWWCWHYTSRFGNRSVVDFAFLFPVLFGFAGRVLGFRWFASISALLLLLSLWQYYQHAKWITPVGKMTPSLYFSNFFEYVQTARSKYPDVVPVFRSVNDMEGGAKGWSGALFEKGEAASGETYNVLKPGFHYSTGTQLPLDSSPDLIVTVGAKLRGTTHHTSASMILDVMKEGKSVRYNPSYLDVYTWKGEWRPMAFDWKIPAGTGDSMKVYVWLPEEAKEEIHLDDLFIEIRHASVADRETELWDLN